MSEPGFLPPPVVMSCDGCEKRVPISKWRDDTRLCDECNKAAVGAFDVEPEQAGLAVLVKKEMLRHYQPKGIPEWAGLSLRTRVRVLVLAVAHMITGETTQETMLAGKITEEFPFLGRTMLMRAVASKFLPPSDYVTPDPVAIAEKHGSLNRDMKAAQSGEGVPT